MSCCRHPCCRLQGQGYLLLICPKGATAEVVLPVAGEGKAVEDGLQGAASRSSPLSSALKVLYTAQM